MVKRVARAQARLYPGFDFKTHSVLITMPWGTYRVTSNKGTVEPAKPDTGLVGLV